MQPEIEFLIKFKCGVNSEHSKTNAFIVGFSCTVLLQSYNKADSTCFLVVFYPGLNSGMFSRSIKI